MQALVVGPTLHTAPAYAAATQNIDRADADREQINAQIHAHQKSKQSLQQTLAETDRFYSTLHADQPTASLPNYLSKSLRELNKPNANGRTSLEQPRLHVNDPAK
jgi:septal ring factor EnvC (AmiA/AmiB activator)